MVMNPPCFEVVIAAPELGLSCCEHEGNHDVSASFARREINLISQ